MTGLDPIHNVVIEIATVVTDDELAVVAAGPDLIVHATDQQLQAMIPVVAEMHAASGLTEAVRADGRPTAVVLSGGNVDPADFAALLARG